MKTPPLLQAGLVSHDRGYPAPYAIDLASFQFVALEVVVKSLIPPPEAGDQVTGHHYGLNYYH